MAIASCNAPTNQEVVEVVASVNNANLTLEEFEKNLGKDFKTTSKELKDNYLDQWIKQQLVLEASQPTENESQKIDHLVESYRKTLIVEQHRKKMAKKHVSQVIDQAEIDSVYNVLNSSFEYRRKLVRLEAFKMPYNEDYVANLKTFIKDEKFDDFYHFLEDYGGLQLVDSTKLTDWKNIKISLPTEILTESSLKENKSFSGEYDGYYYFVKIYEVIDKNEVPPLEYMEEKIKQSIMHKRIKNYFQEYEAALYNKALQQNQIKIYD